MGCASSNNNQQSNPSSKAVGKIEDFKLTNVKPQSALIFIYQNKLYDLTKNYIKSPLNLGDSFFSILKDFKMEDFFKKIPDATQITFLIDVESQAGFYFLIDYYRFVTGSDDAPIDRKKNQFIVISGNSETGSNPKYSGKVVEAYRLWLSGMYLQEEKVAYVDRKTWQTCNAQKILDDIQNSDQDVIFYPGGKQTQQQVKEFLQNANEDTFNRRQYVFQLVGMGADEGELVEGLEYFENNYLKDDLNLPTFNPPVEKNLQSFQKIDYLSSNKHAVVFGDNSKALLNKFASKFVNYEDLNQDYNYSNKEFAFVFDYREKLNFSAISGDFMSYEPNATYLALHVLPKDVQEQKVLFYTLSKSLENFQLNIFLEDGHPQNDQFIQSLMNYQGDWLDFYHALVPYPRMNFMVPYYQNKPMLTQIEGDLNTENSILTAITFDETFKINQSSFFLNGKYNRVKYYQNGQNNQFSLVSNYDYLIKIFEQIYNIGPDDCLKAFNEKYGDQAGEFLGDDGTEYFNDYYAILMDYREAKMEMVMDDDDVPEDEDE